MILGFDWLQSVNPKVDWVNYSVTLKNSFVASSIPVHCTIKVELCSFRVLIDLLHTNKFENSWLTFVL